MPILKLVTAPDPLLSQVSNNVDAIDEKIKTLAYNMLETMYAENGVGLSAVQVGVLKRIITIDVTQVRDKNGILLQEGEQFIMINPEITEYSNEKKEYDEGCLSFPGESVKIDRPAKIKVAFLDLEGAKKEIEADGLLAVCIQHEIDHLNGITISNYLSHLRKEMMIKRLLKQKKRLKF
jgi:peptide deformylase